MRPDRRLSGLPLAGMAGAGVLVGHWLTYLFAVPNHSARTVLLESSGHGYWLVAVKAAVVMACVGLGSVFIRHVNPQAEHEASRTERFVSVAGRLSLIQVVAFTAMEAVERVAASAPALQMFGHHLFVLGLIVQILVASAGALVLLCFGRAAQSLRLLLAPPVVRRSGTLSLTPIAEASAPLSLLPGGGGVRGPPIRS